MEAGEHRVSRSRKRYTSRENTPSSGASCLPPLIKAAIYRYDAVLIGMVAAGLGLEAICLLSWSFRRRASTITWSALGLKEPHSRPVRKGGRKAWSTLDVMRLIAYRVACVHPATIAAKLDRSVSGVYAKLRRLGVPAPPRATLRRFDIDSMAEPELDFGFPDQSAEARQPPLLRRPSAPATSNYAEFRTSPAFYREKAARRATGRFAQWHVTTPQAKGSARVAAAAQPANNSNSAVHAGQHAPADRAAD